jgi:hypothetical protein
MPKQAFKKPLVRHGLLNPPRFHQGVTATRLYLIQFDGEDRIYGLPNNIPFNLRDLLWWRASVAFPYSNAPGLNYQVQKYRLELKPQTDTSTDYTVPDNSTRNQDYFISGELNVTINESSKVLDYNLVEYLDKTTNVAGTSIMKIFGNKLNGLTRWVYGAETRVPQGANKPAMVKKNIILPSWTPGELRQALIARDVGNCSTSSTKTGPSYISVMYFAV